MADFSKSNASGSLGATMTGSQIVDALTGGPALITRIVNDATRVLAFGARGDVGYRIIPQQNCALSFTGELPGKIQKIRLIVQQPDGGGVAIAWPDGVQWIGQEVFVDTSVGSVCCVEFTSDTDGIIWGELLYSVIGSAQVSLDPVIAALSPDLWLDAASGVSVNGSGVVQSWRSKNDPAVSAAFAVGSPTVSGGVLNGRPAISFDGASALTHGLTFTPGSIIAVYRNTSSTASTQPVIASCDSATAGTPAWALRGYIPMGTSGAYARAQGYQVGTSASATQFSGRVSGTLGHWQVMGGRLLPATITAASGATHSTPCILPKGASILATGNKGGAIGACYNSGGNLTDGLTGDICELLVWEKALSQSDYNAVVAALQAKYDLEPAFGRLLYAAFQTNQDGGESGGVEGLSLLTSDDGEDWTHVPTELIFDSLHTMRDPSVTYFNGKFYIACTAGSFQTGYQDRFSVYESTDGRHWKFLTDVVCVVNSVTSTQTWAPEWFHNPVDNTLRLVVHLCFGNNLSQVYEMHPTDDTLQTWSDPVHIALGSYTSVIDSFPFYYKDRWVLFFKDESLMQIQIATASEPAGAYTVLTSGNWAGWGSPVEGPSVLPLGLDGDGNTMIRVYLDAMGRGISYSDAVGAWPDVLTGSWSAPALLTSEAKPQHGTCIMNPLPNFGTAR